MRTYKISKIRMHHYNDSWSTWQYNVEEVPGPYTNYTWEKTGNLEDILCELLKKDDKITFAKFIPGERKLRKGIQYGKVSDDELAEIYARLYKIKEEEHKNKKLRWFFMEQEEFDKLKDILEYEGWDIKNVL